MLRNATPEWDLARTSLMAIGIRATGAVFGFAFNILLSRSLGPSGTGVVLFYLNFATMAGLVATGGMDIVGLRELSRHADNASRVAIVLGRVVANALLCALGFSLAGFLFLWLTGGLSMSHIGLWVDLVCVAILILTAGQKILSDWLVALREFKASQLVYYFINRVASLGLALALVVPARNSAVPSLFICVYAFGLALAVLFALRRMLAHVSWREVVERLSPAMSLLREGMSCGIQNTMFISLNLSPFICLGVFSSASQLGQFGVSQRLVAIVILALTTISQFAMRDLSRAFGRGEFSMLARAMTTSVRLTVLASIGLTLPLLTFSHAFLSIFGSGFAAAAPVLDIMSIGICAQCLGMPFQSALFATNNEIAARNVTIVCAIVGILLNVWLVAIMGALGAALGTGTGLALQSLGHGFCVFRFLPVRPHFGILRIDERPGTSQS